MDETKKPNDKIPEKPSTFEGQHMAPGKTGDRVEGKDPAKVPAEASQVPAKDPAAEAALNKEAEIAKSAPPKPPTGAAPVPHKPASMPAEAGTTSDATGRVKPPAAQGEKPAAVTGAGAPGAEKPAAAAKPAAPAAPAKPAGPTPQPWNSELPQRFKQRYGSGIVEASTYMGQPYMVVDASIARDVLLGMCDAEQFDYCVDVTCVHWPQREKPFDVVWILYSFPHNQRVRIKTMVADGESAPSVADIWAAANWLEREAFDMFGVKFEGHPDLRRILMPEDWSGYPLRKDYGIIQQDQKWVKIHLGIESGQ
jgi:NADH-quinone oxidoreductase subunit C